MDTSQDMTITQDDIEGPRLLRRKIDAGANPNCRIRDAQGRVTRPLLLAVRLGRLEAVKALVEAGASPFISNLPGEASPMHVAASENRPHIVHYLAGLDASLLGLSDANGSPPLMKCVRYARREAAQALIEASIRAGDVRLCANQASTAQRDRLVLHMAINAGCSAAIINQVIDAGIDVNATNEDGQTPLHLAVLNKSYDKIPILIAAGAEVDAVDELNNSTPLHLACKYRDIQAAAHLLDAGADVHAKEKYGHSVREFAQGAGELLQLLDAHKRREMLSDTAPASAPGLAPVL